jgi:predicted phage terminase large subunit-like protein
VLGFDKLTAETHKRWSKDIQSKWLEVPRLMRLKPRGTYKTTLYGVAFLLWAWAVVSPEIRFLYTSANQALLDEVSAEYDRFIGVGTESLYSLVFGIKRDPALKNTADVFNIVGKARSKGSSLMLRTAGGSTNGVHPHFIICDDPLDKKDRESEAVRKSKERWFDSLTPLLVPYQLQDGREVKGMLVIATRWHLQDLTTYARKKGQWDVETESVYADDGTSPRYPEFFGEAQIAEVKESIDDLFFACQYLNNPLPEGSRIFVLDRLHFLRPDQFDTKQGTNYCFFDPSRGKENSDYPAAIWVNVMNGRKVIFDDVDDKVQLEAMLPLIAAKNREHRVRVMRYETNGSMGLDPSLKRAHKDISYALTIEGMHETRNKFERIRTMQPVLYRKDQRGWFFVDDHAQRYPELMNQLLFFPAWGHDDFPDVIEKAVTWFDTNLAAADHFAALAAL